MQTGSQTGEGTIRVAFGTTALRAGGNGLGIDGIGHYTRSIRAQLETCQRLHLTEFAYESARPLGDSSGTGIKRVGSFEPQVALALTTGLPFVGFRSLLQDGIDLVHATDHHVPKLRNTPVIATLMDAIPLSNPEWVRFSRVKGMAWRRSMRWANRIITISSYSRDAIVQHFGIPADNIDVIPLGVEAAWFDPVPGEQVAHTRERLALPERFFLFVGTLQPRKNLQRLIEAHELLPCSVREACPLIIAGRVGWGVDNLVKRLEAGTTQHVRWLNYVGSEDLKVLVSVARALTFPSLGEGFGLPVLEAFAAGTAVLTSTTSSLPEVAGDAAVLVDPENVEELREALLDLSENDARLRKLQTLGRERAKRFTWENTAAQTLESYRRVL